MCRTITLPRRETRLNLLGCPKLANRSQSVVGRSSPYCEDIWGRYCCLTHVLPIVDTCLSCEDIARQICAMVPRIFGQTIQDKNIMSASATQGGNDNLGQLGLNLRKPVMSFDRPHVSFIVTCPSLVSFRSYSEIL